MSQLVPTALSRCVREVVEFVDAAGWDAAPQLFALVPTAELLAAQPELAGTLTDGTELTPVAQERSAERARRLAAGPGRGPGHHRVAAGRRGVRTGTGDRDPAPSVESELEELESELGSELDSGRAVRGIPTGSPTPTHHPERREARLVAGVLRGGESLCLLQLRGETQLLEHPELAPNLVAALAATLA